MNPGISPGEISPKSLSRSKMDYIYLILEYISTLFYVGTLLFFPLVFLQQNQGHLLRPTAFWFLIPIPVVFVIWGSKAWQASQKNEYAENIFGEWGYRLATFVWDKKKHRGEFYRAIFSLWAFRVWITLVAVWFALLFFGQALPPV